MNPIGELDLELLEDYLDDALSPAQVEYVTQRLSAEPELASAMHEIRAERILRAAAWRANEPDERSAARFIGNVSRTIQRDRARRHFWTQLRLGGAAAAAAALFVTGWWLHGSAPSKTPTISRTSIPANPVRPVSEGETGAPFHVALVDPAGRVIPVRHFSKMDEARQFAQDLQRYESRRQDAEQGSAMLVSDHF